MSYSVISERFIKCLFLLKEQGIISSYRQFALKLDFHPQSLNEIIKQKRNVTVDLIQKACTVYNISPNYLYTGSGDLLISESSTNSKSESAKQLQQIKHVSSIHQQVYGEQNDDQNFIEQLPSFSLPNISQMNGTHRCFDIKCDSMEPTLFHGDKVVCNRVAKEDWHNVLNDNFVYAIITQGDVLVRRITNNISEDETISLFSDNKYYESSKLTINEIKEIWYVSTKISPFMPSPNHQRNALHLDIDNMKDTITQQSNVIKTLNSTIEKLLKQNRTR